MTLSCQPVPAALRRIPRIDSYSDRTTDESVVSVDPCDCGSRGGLHQLLGDPAVRGGRPLGRCTWVGHDLGLLLDVKPDTRYERAWGWRVTQLRDQAVEVYGDQIAALAAAAPDWVPPRAPRDWNSDRNGVLVRCECPDSLAVRIRGRDAAVKRATTHPMRCEICRQLFTVASALARQRSRLPVRTLRPR